MADLSDIAQDVDIVGPSGNRAEVSANNDLQVTLDGETVTVDTELPAASALSTNMSNPTTPLLGACLMVQDSSGNWDPVREPAVALDTAGNGLINTGLAAQLDDTATATVTEGNFGNLRINSDRALHVTIQEDAVGIGGGTQYAEDSVHNSGDTGTMVLAVRQDTQVDFGADGDYVPLSINADGELRVTSGGAGGGVTHTDDSAFTVASDDGVPIFGMYDDTSTDSVNEGDAGVVRMTADRKLLISHRRELSGTNTFQSAVTLNATTTNTSSSYDATNYRRGRLYYTIDSTGTPTDIRITLQYSDDNSTFYDVQEGLWGDLRYEDTATATEIAHSVPFPEPLGQYIKIKVDGTGTDGSNTFLVTTKGEFET